MATRPTWLIIMVGLICTGVAVAITEDAYSFGNNNCGIVIQPTSPLAQARKTILINVVTVHTSPSHRSEFTTCINASVKKQTMYAAASCPDPTSDACARCLGEAQSFLDKNCFYHQNGQAVENAMTCTLSFGTNPIVCHS